MLSKMLKKVFGSRNERLLRQYRKQAQRINALEADIQALSDEQLKAKTAEFKQRLSGGETLDDILPEAFAVVREVSQRTLGMRHFDVQMIGGMVLHYGKVAEMRTGEGKTLMSTLPVYLNALSGKGVHLVTVNDYLAKRDAEWMMPIYDFLGVTVGINLTSMDHAAKQEAYAADVTYGTNNEFGFDYLRDNMAFSQDQLVQRPLNFAVIDEVDSILIDEARTPLIISGQVDEMSDLYEKINQLVPTLKRQMEEDDVTGEKQIEDDVRGDFYADEKTKQAHLTEQGHQKVEELMLANGLMKQGSSLYDFSNVTLMHYLGASLRAHSLFHRDVDYVVKNDEVVIVDEHTGRLMDGRRWSDGLHQAVEAKENVQVQMENQTLATITFQNYFRLYNKLSGMTGTADTEAFEMQKIYGLEVAVVPTNKPMVRDDRTDQIFLNNGDKYKAIIEEITACRDKGQPVLVGTASVESSEIVSQLLNKAKLKHEVLNAKNHEREAKIIAQAGRPGAITVATNMAGRGTDIVLGGNIETEIAELPEDATDEQKTKMREEWQLVHDAVIAAGGLHVCGTERNESRRIDNQLRGRSGRQGDPGSSQFYLSLDDNLLRIFAADRMRTIMTKLGVKQGEMIQHKWLNSAIENAQRRVEGMNFDIRKQLLEYDDVANDQRKVVYNQRRQLMEAESVEDIIANMRKVAVEDMVNACIPEQSVAEEWDVGGLTQQLKDEFSLELPIQKWLDEEESCNEEVIHERVFAAVDKAYRDKEAELEDPAVLRDVEKSLVLQVIDNHWRDHLAAMDHLRKGIHLRGFAQKNPAQEYKRESFDMFGELLSKIKYEVVATLARVQFSNEPPPIEQPKMTLNYQHDDMALRQPEPATIGGFEVDDEGEEQQAKPFVRDTPKVGRNDPCPCGSGKKYKQCHGALN
ncbi:MAG: preprotein translocase subunit SecA [Coxiellaceae bacterium]|nr:preprotein translocase subunit SecA [Coxiellaceae bacterium]